MTEKMELRIACVGWGSLIWDPRTLSYLGDWKFDGPILPLEFARESDGQKITLVICPDVTRVTTRWVLMNVPSLHAARENLGLREYDKATPQWIEKRVGFWDRESGTLSGAEGETIAAWARAQKLDGAVWTDLPCGFKSGPKIMPSGQQVVAHLKALVGDAREKAEEYVRFAPAEIDTTYRRLISQELGWSHRPSLQG